MGTEYIGARFHPKWVRGPVKVEDGEIILDIDRGAFKYEAFEPDHRERLLLDLVELRNLAPLEGGSWKPQLALAFARRHGLLWHGPEQIGNGTWREQLGSWWSEGWKLSISASLYITLREAIDTDSDEPVRQYLMSSRDLNFFQGGLPDDKDELLENATIQLAELVTRGLDGCTSTLTAACSLVRDGRKEGEAGDFRFSDAPNSLVAAAYSYLASMMARREEVRECEGCGRLFLPTHGRQRYCEKNCSVRNRVSKHRKQSRTS